MRVIVPLVIVLAIATLKLVVVQTVQSGELSAASARQLASRARRAVASGPPPVPDDTHNEVAGALKVRGIYP